MQNKTFFNNLIFIFIIGYILFFPVRVFSWDDQLNSASDALGEYGISQYQKGLVADAIHELKKCLMANRHNQTCRKQLEKIFAGPFKLASPTVVCRGEQIIFDASKSYGRLLTKLTCLWDFDDGTSFEGLRVAKSYDKAGIYKVKLTVWDDTKGPFSIHKVLIKIVVYGASEVIAGPDIEICCNDKSDYEVNLSADAHKINTGGFTYFWDFGDGSVGKGKSVKHLYKKPGNYVAKVRAQDRGGMRCSSVEDSLNVRLKIPVKANAGENKFAYVGDEVIFDGLESNVNPGSKFIWNFGDKTPLVSGGRVKHVYEKGGKYNVSLRVDDQEQTNCSISESLITATIKSGPIAALKKVSTACVGKEIQFDASGSWHPDNNPFIFTWNFGDGTLIQGASRITHIYKEGGDYTVKVIADDKSASSVSRNMAQIKVHVNRLPFAQIKSKDLYCITEPVVMSGAGSSDPDKDDLKYNWDFGDGYTASGIEVSHIYKIPGEHIVKLKVDDGSKCGTAFVQKSIRVVSAASLETIQNEVRICVPINTDYKVFFDFSKLAFTNLQDFQCYWDFGDGIKAQGRDVTHTYQKGGKYEVILKVDDGKGLPCSSAVDKFIVWLNKPPVALISPNKGCCVGEEFDFDARGSYDPEKGNLTFVWDFGDQVGSKGAQTKHIYKKGGDYIIKLNVDDGSGFGCSSGSSQFKVHVNDKPVADFKVKSK